MFWPPTLRPTGISAAGDEPSTGITYSSNVFGPGSAGRTLNPMRTWPALSPKVKSLPRGNAGLRTPVLAADTGRSEGWSFGMDIPDAYAALTTSITETTNVRSGSRTDMGDRW